MSEESKQVKDDETAELGSVLQLSPHTPTNKIDTIERGKDGEAMISLDDVYEVTGQESFQIVAQNCREYLNKKRLHKSGFNALMISGVEGLVPGFDRLNAIKGGESFLETLKKGFITVIKAVKKFVITCVDWVILRIRTVLGFEKTEKELAIVAETSDAVKLELLGILGILANKEKVKFDPDELYEYLPGNIQTTEAFSIIANRNKTVQEQVENMGALSDKLKGVEKAILDAGSNARASAGRYKAACDKLREAFGNKESFSNADIVEFRHSLDKEIIEELDSGKLIDMLIEIVNEAYGIDLGEVGIDKDFKLQMDKIKVDLDKRYRGVVTADLYTKYAKISKHLVRNINLQAQVKFDANQLAKLKNMIEVDDAELLRQIAAFDPSAGVLIPTYSAYSAHVSNYVVVLEQLIKTTGEIRRSIGGIINWSNKVDKMMVTYMTRDVKAIVEMQEQELGEEGKDSTRFNKDGEPIGYSLDINYDVLFVSRHPHFATLMNVVRAKTGEFRKKNKRVVDEINKGLAKLGATQRL